jgi:cell division protein FtsW
VLLVIAIIVAFFGFALVEAADAVSSGQDPLPAIPSVIGPPAVLALVFIALHIVLRWRGVDTEQIVLPVVALLLGIGLTMIFRLQGPAGAWQQINRGLLPGSLLAGVLIARPELIEQAWRRWALVISLGGLFLLVATAFLGRPDESGAVLALKLGPLPPVQTSEIVKLSLIVFLAWYIERAREEVEGRARLFGRLQVPALRYFIPGTVFVGMATLALVKMSDLGAVLILGSLSVAMLYAGFKPRIFLTVASIGMALFLVMVLVLSAVWQVPDVVQQRVEAFRNPWSQAPVLVNGKPTDLTIAGGPGYQIQQSIYATIAGGVTGTGLGLGSPQNVPLAHSDFILAALAEELGSAGLLALLAAYAILLLRLLRLAILLPEGQVFERLVVVGIAVHLFVQVFIMGAGTFNLLPLTGITVPFLSLGGVALLVNITEVGVALSLAERLKGRLA